MLLYIIRHGDPNYALDCLTERGRKQAAAVARRLQRSGINAVYSSPMGRARETAAPTCELLGLPCHIEEWTHELTFEERGTPFPDGIKRSVSQLPAPKLRENGNILLDYEHFDECPGFAESGMRSAIEHLTPEGCEFLERLGYKEENGVFRIVRANDDRVALFCHAAFTRAWLSILLHIPPHMMWADFGYSHTGVTVLDFEDYGTGFTSPKCLCYSDLSHLYAEGLDMIYDNRIEI